MAEPRFLIVNHTTTDIIFGSYYILINSKCSLRNSITYFKEIVLLRSNERAKRLLVNHDWSIERISEKVGFRHSPYFSACFKKEFGTSPLQFRKQYLK